MLLYQFHRRTQNFINLWFWCLAAHKTKLLSFAQQWVSPFILSSCTSSAAPDADPRDRRQSRLRNPGLPIVEMCPSSDFQYETKTREKYVLVYIGVYIGAGIGYAGGGVRLWCHWHHHTSLHSSSLHRWPCPPPSTPPRTPLKEGSALGEKIPSAAPAPLLYGVRSCWYRESCHLRAK